MKRLDFSFCELSNIAYGGSEEKLGILIGNEPFMFKFEKKNPYGDCFNDVAEYVSSHIFDFLGVPSQTTILGVYRGRNVVACRDFTDGWRFVPFDALGESTLNRCPIGYSYQEIEDIIKRNKKLISVQESLERFWDIFVIDALLANPDRHGKNWGYLKKGGCYKNAPVFDNGSSLFSGLSDDEEIDFIIHDVDELKERIFERPRSLIKENGSVTSYWEVMRSKKYDYCNRSILKICQRIDFSKMNKLVDEIESLSKTKKTFIKTIIRQRYENILKPIYKELLNEEN